MAATLSKTYAGLQVMPTAAKLSEKGRNAMNLTRMLAARAEAGRPVRAMLVGAGKFGSMFLAQVPTTPGLEVRGHRRPLARPRSRSLPHRRLGRHPHRKHQFHR